MGVWVCNIIYPRVRTRIAGADVVHCILYTVYHNVILHVFMSVAFIQVQSLSRVVPWEWN